MKSPEIKYCKIRHDEEEHREKVFTNEAERYFEFLHKNSDMSYEDAFLEMVRIISRLL